MEWIFVNTYHMQVYTHICPSIYIIFSHLILTTLWSRNLTSPFNYKKKKKSFPGKMCSQCRGRGQGVRAWRQRGAWGSRSSPETFDLCLPLVVTRLLKNRFQGWNTPIPHSEGTAILLPQLTALFVYKFFPFLFYDAVVVCLMEQRD